MVKHFVVILGFSLAVAACTAPPPPAANDQPAPAAAAPAPTATAAPAKTGLVAPPVTEAEMISSAMSAAPEAISADATIIAMDEKMQVKTLRKGTNSWTCVPDGPSPGVDPMCVDKNGLEWMNAWMAHKNPPAEKLAFGYMLMGGSDASNDDPFATKPPEGKPWVDTGPHVMVLNIGKHFEGYPMNADNPKAPYVMFGNTPYAHLMLPVK
jgi:hypothetical protein